MRHTRILGVLAVSLAPLLASCGSSNSAGSNATPTVAVHVTATSGSTTATCTPATTDGNGGPYPASAPSDCTRKKTVEVDIISDPKIFGGFSPSNITISVGTTVRFVWKASGHNLAPLHTGIESSGYVFSKTFDTAGTYSYMCQVHPGQNGIIHVQ